MWRAGGLTFSDELGGFRIISVTGAGTVRDPIVIVEEIYDGAATLVIRTAEDRAPPGDVFVTPTFLSIAVTKIVRNASGRAWPSFVLELREALDTPSPYEDGLSFDQMRTFGRPMRSDSFRFQRRVDEPHDRVRFYGGSVAPGATATFRFNITDPTKQRVFYLLQQPQHPVAAPPRRIAPRVGLAAR